MKGLIIYCFILIFFVGCIEEYTPTDIQKIDNLLVVDGTITNNKSSFKISKSVSLLVPTYEVELVDNAELYIETENGDIFNGYGKGGGIYTIQMGELDPQKKYRLHVSIDNEIYKSTFLSPLFTPPIENLFPEKSDEGKPVSINISTRGSEEQSKYYRWSYKEHWEVKSEFFATAGYYINGEFMMFTLNTPYNLYHCWGKDSSKNVILGASDKVVENYIAKKKLIEIEPSDDKLSILYYIAVNQSLLREESYKYYQNLQKNIELTGGLFSSIPSEMKGNIECYTNPGTPVIGYIEVSTTVIKDLYIDKNEGFYEFIPNPFCANNIDETGSLNYPIFVYGQSWAPGRCVDCRYKYNASKEKPDFWPTSTL